MAYCKEGDKPRTVWPFSVIYSPFPEKKDDLHLVSVAGMVDVTCDDLTYDDLNQEYEIWDWD